jgi:hypothetical protein
MPTEAKGQPGRDYFFDITVKKAGVAVDLTLIDGYAIIAYVNEKKIICQWSKNPLTNFKSIEAIDEATGQIKLHLPAVKTAGIDNVQVYCEIIPQVDSEAYGTLKFGNEDGEKFKLIYITSSAKPKIEDLNPVVSGGNSSGSNS